MDPLRSSKIAADLDAPNGAYQRNFEVSVCWRKKATTSLRIELRCAKLLKIFLQMIELNSR